MADPMKLVFAQCARMNRRMRHTQNLLAVLELKRFEPCLEFSGASLIFDVGIISFLFFQHCI
jgi:hypothetical protein